MQEHTCSVCLYSSLLLIRSGLKAVSARKLATLMFGGLGPYGVPENLIRALVRKRARNLPTISNNMGVDGFGMELNGNPPVGKGPGAN